MIAGAVGVAPLKAQPATGVRIVDRAIVLRRGQTIFAHVRIEIPPGVHVPAESRAHLSGATLEVLTAGISNRALPTYPVPTPVTLPGVRAPVLAYTGAIDIGLPLFAAPGLTGPQRLQLLFTYQACDEHACQPATSLAAAESVTVEEPPASNVSIALRLDATRVVIPLLRSYSIEQPASLQSESMVARFGRPFTAFPDDQMPGDSIADGVRPGDARTLLSNRHAYAATVQRLGFLADGCGDPGSAAISATADPTLALDPAKYFLATRAPEASTLIDRFVRLPLAARERASLDDLLNRGLRATYPTIAATPRRSDGREIPDGRRPGRRAALRRFDGAVEDGRVHLSYDIQAFHLSPDHDTQLFIRARWTAEGQSLALSFWVRQDGSRFSIERTDASAARTRRWYEAMPDDAEHNGLILNVIDAADGWAYVLVGQRGYEGVWIDVLKYSPDGLQPIGVPYVYGC
jgi:hypothetical protein